MSRRRVPSERRSTARAKGSSSCGSPLPFAIVRTTGFWFLLPPALSDCDPQPAAKTSAATRTRTALREMFKLIRMRSLLVGSHDAMKCEPVFPRGGLWFEPRDCPDLRRECVWEGSHMRGGPLGVFLLGLAIGVACLIVVRD